MAQLRNIKGAQLAKKDEYFKTNPVTKSLKVESSPRIKKVTKRNKSLTNNQIKKKRMLRNVIFQCKINGSLYFKISLIVKFS